ncbi:MAG: dihydrofolate reductase [Ruminococcus sp.]|nr:dihydrofolate reductase [Candidatus Copronaster equi]
MKFIVAVDNEWNIGYKNDLLFHIPEDMKFFRETTTGKVVVMGRKTLESFPNSKPLKNRVNIVLSRTESDIEGAEFVKNTDELFKTIKKYNSDDVYVIGGASIYELLLPFCDTALITHIDTVAEKADKKFPELNQNEWEIFSESDKKESNGYTFKFVEYKRK